MIKQTLQFNFYYWQRLFVYFWVFSLVGHYFEVIWAYLISFTTGSSIWNPTTITLIPLAIPYGLGAVSVILLVGNYAKNNNLNIWAVYFISIISCSVIEYTCSAILVNIYGFNKYWDYSERLFNLNGYICLEASLLFGLLATIFIYQIYPIFERYFNSLNKSYIDVAFWIMIISYSIDLIYYYSK